MRNRFGWQRLKPTIDSQSMPEPFTCMPMINWISADFGNKTPDIEIKSPEHHFISTAERYS